MGNRSSVVIIDECGLTKVPQLVMIEILKFLSLNDLYNLMVTNKRMLGLCHDDKVKSDFIKFYINFL